MQTKQSGYATIIVNRETVTMEQLAKEASIGSTFSEGEILGMMKHIFEAAARKFAEGKKVSLGALGALMPGLHSKWSETAEQQTKRSLSLYAKYDPTKEMQAAIEQAELVWVKNATDTKAESEDSGEGDEEDENTPTDPSTGGTEL